MAGTLEAILDATRPAPVASRQLLPVLPALEQLLPDGGLRRGSSVAVAGSTSLLLALLAGPSAAGSWCAVVGALPGPAAAAEAGIDLTRLALIPDAGTQWPAVVAALLDALDIVAVRPPAGVRDVDLRRLAARTRERRSVLIALETAGGRARAAPSGLWAVAETRLRITASHWEGIGLGHGRLLAREVEVVAEGRGALARPRRVRLELPAPDGEIRLAPQPLRPARQREVVGTA